MFTSTKNQDLQQDSRELREQHGSNEEKACHRITGTNREQGTHSTVSRKLYPWHAWRWWTARNKRQAENQPPLKKSQRLCCSSRKNECEPVRNELHRWTPRAGWSPSRRNNTGNRFPGRGQRSTGCLQI
jgi:hypothetical protein